MTPETPVMRFPWLASAYPWCDPASVAPVALRPVPRKAAPLAFINPQAGRVLARIAIARGLA